MKKTIAVIALLAVPALASAQAGLSKIQFLALQQELANTEDRIQAARRFYNNNVQVYNARIKQFPSMVIASMGGFTEEQFFEVEPAIREARLRLLAQRNPLGLVYQPYAYAGLKMVKTA